MRADVRSHRWAALFLSTSLLIAGCVTLPPSAPSLSPASSVGRRLRHRQIVRTLGTDAAMVSVAEMSMYAAANDAMQLDGGSVSGGVPPSPEELDQARLRSVPPGELRDEEIGPALMLAHGAGEQLRYAQLLAQLRDRHESSLPGVGLPVALPRGSDGHAMVTPEIALSILENSAKGQAPFRPELGKGGCSWFVTEGSPYTGVSGAHTVPVQVELLIPEGVIRFEQADLLRLFAEEEARGRPEVEQQVRERFRIRTGQEAPAQLSKTLAERVERQLRGLAETRMWERVAAQVRASPAGAGEVILPPGGKFSNQPGRFLIIARAEYIRLREGLGPLLEGIRRSGGGSPLPELEKSAEELARNLRLAGRVRHVLRVAGRILIVVAIAADIHEIITAEDHLEATVVSAAGWAGATAASTSFAALWTPADTAGPWAWAAHGVGMLASGAVGYWLGSSTTRHVYRLVVRTRGQVNIHESL
jgi:hypothetical protein